MVGSWFFFLTPTAELLPGAKFNIYTKSCLAASRILLFLQNIKKSEQHHHRPTELNNVYTILLFFYFCSTNYLLLSPALGQDSGCLWSSLCLTANSVKGHSCATWLELLCTAPSAGLHLCAGTHTGSSSHQVSEPPPETAI